MRLLTLGASIILLAACNSAISEPTPTHIPLTQVSTTTTLESVRDNQVRESEPGATATFEPFDTALPTLEPGPVPVGTELGSDKPVILFQLEGGIAGTVQNWKSYRKGRVYDQQENECQVEPESILELLKLAEDKAFFKMSFEETPNFCCDFFTFTLSVRSDELENFVRVSDGDPNMPDELRELIAAVQ
jgi:hypothetical protein